MKPILWVLDFDGTISHREPNKGDMEIETFQETKHHYMSKIVCDFFQNELKKGNKIILVTARRRELYERIYLPFPISKAITSFGAYIYDYVKESNPTPKPFLETQPLPTKSGYALEDNMFYRQLERDIDGNKVYEIPETLGKDKVMQKLKTEYPEYTLIAIGDDPEYDGAMKPYADICYTGRHKPDLMTYLLNNQKLRL